MRQYSALLDKKYLEKVRRAGVIVIPNVFSPPEIDRIKKEIELLEFDETCSGAIVNEAHGLSSRARHGDHLNSQVLRNLTRFARLRETAETILDSAVYVYQFKINTKAALTGAGWPWHNDLIYWKREDGLPYDRVLTIGIFLSKIDRFNGPMIFLQGSHDKENESTVSRKQCSEADLQDFVGTDLRYTISKRDLFRLWSKHEVLAAEGPTGSIVIFDSKILHCSPDNVSPFDRDILFITYSAVDNVPTSFERPEFLVARNFDPLLPLEHELL
jgi:ectoine hydroxylase